jgi:hypothetical protein
MGTWLEALFISLSEETSVGIKKKKKRKKPVSVRKLESS